MAECRRERRTLLLKIDVHANNGSASAQKNRGLAINAPSHRRRTEEAFRPSGRERSNGGQLLLEVSAADRLDRHVPAFIITAAPGKVKVSHAANVDWAYTAKPYA